MTARTFLPTAATAFIISLLVVVAAFGQENIHRNGFSGRRTFWVKADANIPFEELSHKIDDQHGKSAPTSEGIKIKAEPAPGSVDPGTEYVHYAYEIPPAPVTDRLTVGVWVKAFRGGAQVKARLVLPKERDPKNPDAPLTTILQGDVYKDVRQWQPLNLGNVKRLVEQRLPVLHAQLGRAVDPTDAYIDRVLLNVYLTPGISEVWIDDLEVGPVRPDLAPPPVGPPPGTKGAILTTRLPTDLPTQPPPQAKAVRFQGNQITVDGEPFLFTAIRHTDTPLKTLRDAQFNTVWFPGEATPEAIEEAIRHGFWIVPSVPIPPAEIGPDGQPIKPDAATAERDADRVGKYLRKFLAEDAVLMWDLGSGRTAEDARRVLRSADVIGRYDRGRPRAVDVWDGFAAYGDTFEAVGTHRWPLFTSLELANYRDWLIQRRILSPRSTMNWTWVQTHLPDWFVTLTAGRADVDHFDDPVGPHPEQIRILTYLSLAAGCRGLGFWSDRFLANTHHGRDRLLELALLNTEIDMLKPLLLRSSGPAQWIDTYAKGYKCGEVRAAVIQAMPNDREPKMELVVLPVWLGPHTQHCPPPGTLPNLKFTVPNVPEGASPWLLTPAGITALECKRVAGGMEVTLPEFDLTAVVVFTGDLDKQDSKIVRWQDHTLNRIGKQAAEWALEQAKEQYEKTLQTHKRICEAAGPLLAQAQGPSAEIADLLFAESRKYLDAAGQFKDNHQWDAAYKKARRAQQPLRVLMRAHWDAATKTLDVKTASPYAASFYSLPLHWVLMREVGSARAAGTSLAHGQFELSEKAPAEGASVASLPGWTVRKSTLDSDGTKISAVAAIVNSDKETDAPPKTLPRLPHRYNDARVHYQPDEAYRKPPPDLGRHCLKLTLLKPQETDTKGNLIPRPPVLERAFLAVDSEVAELPPGQLVRISFWAKASVGSADGLVVYDSAGGEPLGMRTNYTAGWKEYHLYRRMPANGKLAVTFALTGEGFATIDDVRVEPLVGGVVEPGTPVSPPRVSAQPVARGQRR